MYHLDSENMLFLPRSSHNCSSRGRNSQLSSSRDGDSHRGDPEIATLVLIAQARNDEEMCCKPAMTKWGSAWFAMTG